MSSKLSDFIGEFRYIQDRTQAQLKFTERETEFVLDTVFVPASLRNCGIGTLLIRRLLCLADALGKKIILKARPMDTSSSAAIERLVEYYGRFGFVVSTREAGQALMERPWSASPQVVEVNPCHGDSR